MQLQNEEKHWSVLLRNVNLLLPLVPVQMNCNKIKSFHFSKWEISQTVSSALTLALKTQKTLSVFDVFGNNMRKLQISPRRNTRRSRKQHPADPTQRSQRDVCKPHTSDIYLGRMPPPVLGATPTHSYC